MPHAANLPHWKTKQPDWECTIYWRKPMTDSNVIDAPRIDPEPDLATEALDAMTSPNITAVLQIRMSQIRDFGHTAEEDDMHPLVHLPKTADEYLRRARTELQL